MRRSPFSKSIFKTIIRGETHMLVCCFWSWGLQAGHPVRDFNLCNVFIIFPAFIFIQNIHKNTFYILKVSSSFPPCMYCLLNHVC